MDSKPSKSDGKEITLDQALHLLVELSVKILTVAAPVFRFPSFYDPDLPPERVVWPRVYELERQWRPNPATLAAIGAVLRQWATTELVFDAGMRQMANYPPIKDTKLAKNLDLYSFKAKAVAWKTLSKSLLHSDPEGMEFANFLLSRAKQLSSIRNELAHWNEAVGSKPGQITLIDRGLTKETSYWSVWSIASLHKAAADVENLRTALLAYTQYCFKIWQQTHWPSPEIPAELTSDTGLLILRSYLAQRPISRPPRRRGYPPQREPSPP